jgi:hypothetical protein
MTIADSNLDMQFTTLAHYLQDICSSCNQENTAGCIKSMCLIGFSRRVIDFYQAKGNLNISGAETLVPTSDFKVYEKELLTASISETCKLCRQCRDNHANDCIISLVRNCMEYALWGESISYPGNIIEYLGLVRNKDSETAAFIMENYRIKNTAS